MKTTKIGFIGQGWIGKHYADDFENRLYEVVRYALEEPYCKNIEQIKSCQIVFIAVPTPTTPQGFSCDAVRDALSQLASGTTAVIKSTLLPGTTELLQKEFPELFVLHSPEFLVEKTAAEDAAKPKRNLVGIPYNTPEYREKAEAIIRILPDAPYSAVMGAKEAEIVKYAGNTFLFTKVLFMNLLYDYTTALGGDWDSMREAMIHDPRIGESHTTPVHNSGHVSVTEVQPQRGAGGHCFIKDFEALRLQFAQFVPDEKSNALLTTLVQKNIDLLVKSGKDLDLLVGVYGDGIVQEPNMVL